MDERPQSPLRRLKAVFLRLFYKIPSTPRVIFQVTKGAPYGVEWCGGVGWAGVVWCNLFATHFSISDK